MALARPPICDFGWQAVEFDLPGVDGRNWTLADAAGERGTVVMFICNHCPYVVAVVDRLVADIAELAGHGIGAIAVMSNDTEAYRADSFDNMKRFARQYAFGFPYVIDESQAVARAYGAACTPDFFGFDAALRLRYRGRLDDARNARAAEGRRRELVEAMLAIAETGEGPRDQIASMGCSIKWRHAG
jgi:peroxiredoxin